MNGLPRVHVLLVNYNGWRDTIECLESVFRLDYPDVRVIVCDNGSSDGSVERIQAWAEGTQPATSARVAATKTVHDISLRKPIHYVLGDRAQAEDGRLSTADARLVLVRLDENLGFTGGNNVGLRYLQSRREAGGGGELVWILNNDTVVESSSLREMVARLIENPELGAIGATVFWYDRPDSIQVAGGGRLSRWSGFTTVARVPGDAQSRPPRFDFISGACILTRLDVVRRVGLLDERYFMYSEEVDWCLRMRQVGMQLGYASQARVWHKGEGSIPRYSERRDYHTVRSALLLIHKFEPGRLPVAVAWSISRCLIPKLVRRQWRRARPVMTAYHDFFSAVSAGRTSDPSPSKAP
jgi:GT2 family glycosyltransferase